MAPFKLQTAHKTVGISSETDRLTRVAIAGLPSVEQELTQLYHPNKSLFLDSMDVLKSRAELQAYAAELALNGVDVLVMKEELANILDGTGLTKDAILSGLLRKAEQISASTDSNGTLSPSIKEKLAHLLELDMQIYGTSGALALAKALSLDPQSPLGNIIYSRDQTNVVFGQRIVSNMAFQIRKPEVQLYEMFYFATVGLGNTITIPKREKFEGGDLYVHADTVFIGVGARTSLNGAMQIFSQLKAPAGTKFAIVMNGKLGGTFKEQQESMHLDTFSMPIGDKQIAVCEQEAQKRHVYMVEMGSDGSPKFIPTNKTFIQYLVDEGYKIVAISKAEQSSFGCNILMLDSNTAFMPISPDAAITKALTDMGKTVIRVPMEATTNGFGATHCAVAQLKRE